MARPLPELIFLAEGQFGVAQVTFTQKKTYLKSIVLSNITNAPVLVTFVDGLGNTKGILNIEAYDQVANQYSDGWDFDAGLKVQAAAGASINYQFFGVQDYL